jgi:hypothetical protein
MRGWLSLFTRERDSSGYRTGIVVASAEPATVQTILAKVQREYPNVAFSFLGPRAYDDIVGERHTAIWLEDAKLNPSSWLLRTRGQEFDLAILIWPGQPTFRKAKLAGLLLNPRRWVIYDENSDKFIVDRANYRRLLRLIASRYRRGRPGPFLHPLGWVYLLVTTAGLARRAGRIARTGEHL